MVENPTWLARRFPDKFLGQDREGQSYVAILGLLVGIPQQLCDGPDE